MPEKALIAAVKNRRIRLGETMVSQAALQRRPMQLADSKQDTSSLVLDVIQRAGFRALLEWVRRLHHLEHSADGRSRGGASRQNLVRCCSRNLFERADHNAP